MSDYTVNTSTLFQEINILYATQTGVSEEIAQRIFRTLIRLGFKNVTLSIMDKFSYKEKLFRENNPQSSNTSINLSSNVSLRDASNLNQLESDRPAYFIFVCSTTGQGNHPTNMQQFWKYLLLRKHSNTSLKHVQFTVFGLGDSSYSKYNFVAKKLLRRLYQLGSIPFYEKGFADDQHPWGFEGGFQEWHKGLKQYLIQQFHIKYDESSQNNPFPPFYKLIKENEFIDSKNLAIQIEESPYTDHSEEILSNNNDTIIYDKSTFGTLISNERLTPVDHWQDVRHIVIDIKGTGLRYLPGDAAAIMYKNPLDYVEKLLQRLNLNGDSLISFQKLHSNSPDLLFHKSQLTWREIFEQYLDVCGTPTKFFYEQLSHFTTDEREKERLDYLISPEATDAFWKYNQREKRTYLEALEDFPSATPPEEYIIDLIRPIQPRYFSISSSQKIHENEIHLTIAIVQFKTPFERTRFGKCTNWIKGCTTGTKIPIWITKGTLSLPQSTSPLIMVGPGTGVAPFRSFIYERKAQHKQGELVGSQTLFFGSRNKSKDFYYSEEWNKLESELSLSVITAFSRDQSQKIYVQHRILEQAEKLWKLITFEGAYFYIAGNSNDMPKGVRNMMKQIAQKCGGKTLDEAEEWIQRLEKQNRYQEETW